VIGRSTLGRLLLDTTIEAEVLPAELEQVSVGGKWVSLAMSGPPAKRDRRTVSVVPERAAVSRLFTDTVLVPDRSASSIRNVGELYRYEGVRDLYKSLRRCRVDGRPVDVGDVVAVHGDFSLQLGDSHLLVHA
jgi:hypothetical protein